MACIMKSTLTISEQIRAYKQKNSLVNLHFCKEFLENSSNLYRALTMNSPMEQVCLPYALDTAMELYRHY